MVFGNIAQYGPVQLSSRFKFTSPSIVISDINNFGVAIFATRFRTSICTSRGENIFPHLKRQENVGLIALAARAPRQLFFRNLLPEKSFDSEF